MRLMRFGREPALAPRLVAWLTSLVIVFLLCVLGAYYLRPPAGGGGGGGGAVLPNAPGEDDAPADKVVVNVLPDGTFRVEGASCSAGQLDEFLARESRSRSSPPLVRIRCQAEVPYRYVQDVMDSCCRVGIPRVSFVEDPLITEEEG